MKIERVFNEESNIKLSDLVNSLLIERIDKYISEQYNSLNYTTSSEKGDEE